MARSLPRLDEDGPKFEACDRCNTYVLSWIKQALDPEVLQCVSGLETAFDVWNDSKIRYYQGDFFVSQICKKKFTCSSKVIFPFQLIEQNIHSLKETKGILRKRT